MQQAIEQFRANLIIVKNLGAVYTALKNQTTTVLDLSEILRSELVMAVSALDLFIHELVKIGMIQAYTGTRPKTQAFYRFQVPLKHFTSSSDMPFSLSDWKWLEEEITIRHGYQSFQKWDKIAEAIRLISDISLWQEVAEIVSISDKDIKERLNLIVKRRDKIAHEFDIDPSYPGKRWPIDEQMVNESIEFIETIVEAMFVLLK